MVAASSRNSTRPSLPNVKKQRSKGMAANGADAIPHASAKLSKDLPSTETYLTHLRLLAAFSNLKQHVLSISELHHDSDPSSSTAEQRWTIFVANAVDRFERWLRAIFPSHFAPSLTCGVASDGKEMDVLMDATEPLTWTEEMLPPLDVLMVLHSYMLNPHEFLHDCLRCGGLALWKAGFPWDLIARNIDSATLEYKPTPKTEAAFEKMTCASWSYMKPPKGRSLKCPGCSTSLFLDWTTLYSEGTSQMEKGNILISFTKSCPICQSKISQESVCKSRLRSDLELLLKDDIAMPETLLSPNGLIPTAKNSVEPTNVLLNKVLKNGMAQQLIEQIDKAQRDNVDLQIPSCAVNDSIIDSLMDGSVLDQAEGTEKMDKVASALMTSARRMGATYNRNFSPFGLDLVGAVLRQGVFVEKMSYFDWIHSPAVDHTVSCGINRYDGFFKVMQHNPGKTAVPTFDVDLIWHTQQLTPTKYYNYSLANCNNIFIDHDDKIVDNVLNDSFEWTCEQFASLNGNDYDKCLCWCCAILEKDALSSKAEVASTRKLTSRIKGMLKLVQRDGDPSEAELQVVDIQSLKFENEYANECKRAVEAGERPPSKRAFFESYVWHYPKFAPHPDEVEAL